MGIFGLGKKGKSSGKKVLMTGKMENSKFHPFDKVSKILTDIVEESGHSVKISENLDDYRYYSLSAYDLLISYTDEWETEFNEAWIDGLKRFVENGGGIIVIHSGIGSKSDAYHRLIGAKFTEHPPRQNYSVKIMSITHPVTAEIASFTVNDEFYKFEFFDDVKVEVLAYSILGEVSQPSVWVRDVG